MKIEKINLPLEGEWELYIEQSEGRGYSPDLVDSNEWVSLQGSDGTVVMNQEEVSKRLTGLGIKRGIPLGTKISPLKGYFQALGEAKEMVRGNHFFSGLERIDERLEQFHGKITRAKEQASQARIGIDPAWFDQFKKEGDKAITTGFLNREVAGTYSSEYAVERALWTVENIAKEHNIEIGTEIRAARTKGYQKVLDNLVQMTATVQHHIHDLDDLVLASKESNVDLGKGADEKIKQYRLAYFEYLKSWGNDSLAHRYAKEYELLLEE